MLLLDVLERLMPSALTDPVSYTVRWDGSRWPIRGALIYTVLYIRQCWDCCSPARVACSQGNVQLVFLLLSVYLHKLNSVEEFLCVWLQNDWETSSFHYKCF